MPLSESENNVLISGNERNLGLYIAGLPGAGKSTLIQNLSLRDIQRGHGVCVIDPTGTLIRGITHHIPKWREKDVILFDRDDPVPVDFFSYDPKDVGEREVLLDMLVNIISISGAPISKPRVLRLLNTLFEANEHPTIPDEHRTTFLDIKTFLTDKTRRDEILRYCSDYRQKDWAWLDGVKNPEREHDTILERVSKFFELSTLRVMFSAKRPKLKIADVMAEGKILLINLRDTQTDYDIAALFTAKFRQVTFARRDITNEENIEPYYLYIDECHDVLKFATEDFDKILTGARKFKLCLTLANQLPLKLPDAIKGQLSTLQSSVIFRLQPPEQLAPFRHRFPVPYTPKNRSYDLYQLEYEYNEYGSKIDTVLNQRQDRQDGEDADDRKERRAHNAKISKEYERLVERKVAVNDRILKLKYEIDEDNARAQVDYIKLIDQLPTGEAVYIPMRGEPFIIQTPPPLDKHDDITCYKHFLNLTKENFRPDEIKPKLYTEEIHAHSPSKEKDGGSPGAPSKQPKNPHKKRGTGPLK